MSDQSTEFKRDYKESVILNEAYARERVQREKMQTLASKARMEMARTAARRAAKRRALAEDGITQRSAGGRGSCSGWGRGSGGWWAGKLC